MDARDRLLLVVDDDDPFRQSLMRAMARRGFAALGAGSISDALILAQERLPPFAAVDLRLADGNGLELVTLLRRVCPAMRIVMLTGYANIASAVGAIRAGAVDYLPKPVEADRLRAILLGEAETVASPAESPMTPERVRWEHIHRVYEDCDRNVSETARRLKMHRRTLQRILSKHAPH